MDCCIVRLALVETAADEEVGVDRTLQLRHKSRTHLLRTGCAQHEVVGVAFTFAILWHSSAEVLYSVHNKRLALLRYSADFIFEAADRAMREMSMMLGPIDDLRATMKKDYALLLAQPQAHVIELLHRAAYR